MATTKPRLTITLEPHTHLVISTLAELQGHSKSKVITDLLDAVVPVRERTARVIQMAQTAQTTVTDDMRKSLEESEQKLSVLLNDAMGEMGMLEQLVSADESSAKVGADTGAESRSDLSQPPYSNRGVRSKPTPKPDQKTKPKKPAKSKSSDTKPAKTKNVSTH